MATLDGFINEIRAAGGDAPEVERLELMLRALQTDDSPAAIADYDRIIRALCHPALPLLERVQVIIAAMEGRQP
jgi:hypothetical protein